MYILETRFETTLAFSTLSDFFYYYYFLFFVEEVRVRFVHFSSSQKSWKFHVHNHLILVWFLLCGSTIVHPPHILPKSNI